VLLDHSLAGQQDSWNFADIYSEAYKLCMETTSGEEGGGASAPSPPRSASANTGWAAKHLFLPLVKSEKCHEFSRFQLQELHAVAVVIEGEATRGVIPCI